MQKVFVAEKLARKVKWTEGGRIVHTDLEDKVIAIENYTKAALAKIIKFLTKDETAKTKRSAKFNATARNMLAGIDGFDMIEDNGNFLAIVNNNNPMNKICRTWYKATENVKIYLKADQPFKINTRYEMCFDADGTVIFQELEPITPENLNAEYSQALLNVYECEI